MPSLARESELGFGSHESTTYNEGDEKEGKCKGKNEGRSKGKSKGKSMSKSKSKTKSEGQSKSKGRKMMQVENRIRIQ